MSIIKYLLVVFMFLFSQAGNCETWTWKYIAYNNGEVSFENGKIELNRVSDKFSLRFYSGLMNTCWEGDLDANPVIENDSLVIYARKNLSGCERIRFSLNLDGSGGARAISTKGDVWDVDPKKRGLTSVAPDKLPLLYSFLKVNGSTGFKVTANASVTTTPPPISVPATPSTPARAPTDTEYLGKKTDVSPVSLENQTLTDAKFKDEELSKLKTELEQLKRNNLATQNSLNNRTTNYRKALIIGNDNYKFVTKLQNAREEAKSMADTLTQFGYSITLKLDLTEKDMKSALRVFKNQVDPGDEVAIFYAGHGVQLGTSNYLLPVDVGGESEDQVRDEAIPLQRIVDDMSDRKAKFTLAMLDACRDNPFKGSGRSVGAGARGLAPTSAATGQMVVFSAGTGQQALDKLGPEDKNKNGLFTRIFLQEARKPGLTIDRIVKNVRTEVARLAQSVGHEQVPAIYDQVLGDFFFLK